MGPWQGPCNNGVDNDFQSHWSNDWPYSVFARRNSMVLPDLRGRKCGLEDQNTEIETVRDVTTARWCSVGVQVQLAWWPEAWKCRSDYRLGRRRKRRFNVAYNIVVSDRHIPLNYIRKSSCSLITSNYVHICLYYFSGFI